MGIFDNAINVTINNQEVESITTNNNGLIYQRLPGYKLTLTADKNNVNVGETVTFSALLTNRNEPIANEIIDLCGITLSTPISKTITANTPTHVGCKYSFPTIPTLSDGKKIYLNEEHTIEMSTNSKNETNLLITVNNDLFAFGRVYSLTMENGIMTIGYYSYSTTGYTANVNCQSTNTRIITSGINVAINDYGLYGTTNANGIATITYTPTSAGTKIITAKALDLTDTIQIQVT